MAILQEDKLYKSVLEEHRKAAERAATGILAAQKPYLSQTEAACYLGKSERTVLRFMEYSGIPKRYLHDGAAWVIKRADIDAALSRRPRQRNKRQSQ